MKGTVFPGMMLSIALKFNLAFYKILWTFSKMSVWNESLCHPYECNNTIAVLTLVQRCETINFLLLIFFVVFWILISPVFSPCPVFICVVGHINSLLAEYWCGVIIAYHMYFKPGQPPFKTCSCITDSLIGCWVYSLLSSVHCTCFKCME